MTCIRTGGRVFFPQYGKTVQADLYQVNDVLVVRTNPGAIDYVEYNLNPERVEYVVLSNEGGANEFWREDLGIFVIPMDNLERRGLNT